MRVLGIETSCDETGVALYDTTRGLMDHIVYSQTALHAQYGGVVPELAARDHLRKTLPLLDTLLARAATTAGEIDGVAYTAGPGLIGALLVGAGIGRALAYAWGVPAVAVHHMEGHLLSPLLEDPAPAFPFVALLVSGGHTQLVAVRGVGDYTLLGETIDDAVGEAFDKTAKLLGLGYPGGAALARLAEQGRSGIYTFPRPMTREAGLDFSFSGLKTAARLAVQKAAGNAQAYADIARGFEEAVVDTLWIKCARALSATGYQRLVVAGGVSANSRLRARLSSLPDTTVFFPRLEFCGDNGAMIAYVGALRLSAGETAPLAIHAQARWDLSAVGK